MTWAASGLSFFAPLALALLLALLLVLFFRE